MQEFIDWYWQYGVLRGTDPSDPNRELRKVSIGGWLDPLVRIIDRNQAIQSNSSEKACLALWGPSQAGKSTLLSRYIDGRLDDGSDSALTWSDAHKTRFSPPESGANNIPTGTLVFNPFNHKSDASGIATRYTLKDSFSGVDPEYPIEILFTTRAQIIQSICLGYLSECEPVGENIIYTQDSFQEAFPSFTASSGANPDPEAYLLLKDIANVIEFMRGQQRFSNLFKNESWEKRIRPAMVAAPGLVSSKASAEAFMAKIFWDESPTLTKFYRKADALLQDLSSEWRGKTILASMEVGALLLDIDSYRNFSEATKEEGYQIRNAISHLDYRVSDNTVKIGVGRRPSTISGNHFGYFQAICAELKVPLKKENLNIYSSFRSLIEKCDFLDFPGVSNKNPGTNREDDNAGLIKLKKASPIQLFSTVFKQGKTQCFVYNYVKKYGIDAFAILVRTNQFPSQFSLLNAGIKEWLQSYEPEWRPGLATDMPIFVDMTFFSSLLNNVHMNGVGNGFAPVIDQIQQLSFARKETARFFATNYPQFPDGFLTPEFEKSRVIQIILSEPLFCAQTGLSAADLDAVCESNGGLEYMFDCIAQSIQPEKRRSKCSSILERDLRDFNRLIAQQLPTSGDPSSNEMKNRILAFRDRLLSEIQYAEQYEDSDHYYLLAEEVRNLFAVNVEILEPLPLNAGDLSKKQLIEYVKTQVGHWFDAQIANLKPSTLYTDDESRAVLITLRDSICTHELCDTIRDHFSTLSNNSTASAARYPFALAMHNALAFGTTRLSSNAICEDKKPAHLDSFISARFEKSSEKEGSPYYHSVLVPAIERLTTLSKNDLVGDRPPQLGDDALSALYHNTLQANSFHIA